MRAVALVLLLGSVARPQEDPFRAAVDAGVTFPAREELDRIGKKSAWHKKVVATLLDPALWASSLKTLEERTGIKVDKIEIKILIAEIPNAPACGTGRAGKGSVTLDLDKLAKYEKGAEETRRRMERPGAIVVVPPARLELTIPHELTHCFQGVDQPEWFMEGMADYVGRDPNHVSSFKQAKVKLKAIDAEIPHDHVYARGRAFFEWLEAAHGAEKLKKFIALALEGKPAAEAAAAVTGSDWAAITKAETEWSSAWVKKF